MVVPFPIPSAGLLLPDLFFDLGLLVGIPFCRGCRVTWVALGSVAGIGGCSATVRAFWGMVSFVFSGIPIAKVDYQSQSTNPEEPKHSH